MRGFFLAAAFLLIATLQAQAQLGVVAWGVGGSLLLDKAGQEAKEAIDHARDAGMALLERANTMGKDRLDQVDGILKKTVGDLIGKSEDAMVRILENAKKEANALRESIIADLKQAIWDAECAGKRLLISDLQQALGGIGTVINSHQIQLSPPLPVPDTRPWYCSIVWWCENPNVVQIREPFGDTYIIVRDKMEAAIGADRIKEDTPVHRIVGTYEYLSAFALKTSCFYPGSSDVWNREYLKYREAGKQWRNAAIIAVR